MAPIELVETLTVAQQATGEAGAASKRAAKSAEADPAADAQDTAEAPVEESGDA